MDDGVDGGREEEGKGISQRSMNVESCSGSDLHSCTRPRLEELGQITAPIDSFIHRRFSRLGVNF